MIEQLIAAERRLADGSPEALAAAERLYRAVAEADPRNAIAIVGLARIARARGDAAAARAFLERALTIDPEEAAGRRLRLELEADDAGASAAAPRRGWLGRILDRLLRRRRPVS